ncbi:MAG TPA: helix-turn-helix domain-containing protein [Stackebrandtia sp.]|jgi:DNA-binding NarL/FixJ family response regulator|uniref:helix-turn-helix domain-containing protein n=1 Tax=Stackebrandtia sp. TaxID=2023065 RepID=UPI002D56E6D1|nr:helix-turn-helix domain-containing protein [Stackebrandtia sp.]HZE41126.1 helix-turn-helix domain-containing protein [Stackebrandtia sp.]
MPITTEAITPAAAAPPELPLDQHELLRLLAGGLSDQAIGRRLGMSRRTVQRRIRSLMDFFDVQTRFQLGMCAARRVISVIEQPL